MGKRTTARATCRPELTERPTVDAATATMVERELLRAFSPAVMDELRARTGYNPRQRVITALRLTLTVVEAFLVGQTLSFASLRAIFARRFQAVWSCPFQLRFKQPEAAAFFREALGHLVSSVVGYSGDVLTDPSKPDGTPRKLLDVSRIHALGWQARIPLRQGIEDVYRWYQESSLASGTSVVGNPPDVGERGSD